MSLPLPPALAASARNSQQRTGLHFLPMSLLAMGLCLWGSACATSGRLNTTEKMMWSTYPLATEKGMAAAFIVMHRDPALGQGKVPVVFTSYHVLKTVNHGPLIIGVRMPGEDDDPAIALLKLYPDTHQKRPFYVKHPGSDVAAFPLHLPEELTGVVDLSSFIQDRHLARPGRRLHTGTDVSFLGYPDVLPGTSGAFPVLRSGRVASYPLGTPASEGRFLINADVYPGDSGAPVFVSRKRGSPWLAGMIIQRVSETTDTFSHLAIAVDADTIRETLALLPNLYQESPPPMN